MDSFPLPLEFTFLILLGQQVTYNRLFLLSVIFMKTYKNT